MCSTLKQYCLIFNLKNTKKYHITYKRSIQLCDYRLGVVACSCNPVTWRPGSGDGLRSGVLLSACLCRSGVRTKPGINMGYPGEPRWSRLSLRRNVPAQGGNTAGKSSRVVQQWDSACELTSDSSPANITGLDSFFFFYKFKYKLSNVYY